MGRIESEWRGLAVVEICGAEPETLLNACLCEGLTPIQPDSLDACTLRMGIFEKELPRLRQLAEKHFCELRVLSQRGGSRTRRLLLRRSGLLLTAGLLLAGLLISSLFIWEIRVTGADRESVGRILRVLADCGVKSGCYWPSLDADAVRDRALPELPELVWLTVNVHGSIAEVKLLRREEKPEIFRESDAADLVASHAGIVRQVCVFSGKAAASPGRAVTEGEVLIASEVDSITAAPRFVRARGEVWADTWYELTALCPPAEQKSAAYGATKTRFAVCIAGNRFNLYRNNGKAIDGCDKIVHEYNLGIPGLFSLTVTLVCEKQRAYETAGPYAWNPEEQGQRLIGQLAEHIEGEILSPAISWAEKDGLLYVTLRTRCRENIAVLSR